MNKFPEQYQPNIINILQNEGCQIASITYVTDTSPPHIVLSNNYTNHKQLRGIRTFFDIHLGADDGNEDGSEFQQGHHQHINKKFYHLECLRNFDMDLILTIYKIMVVNLGNNAKFSLLISLFTLPVFIGAAVSFPSLLSIFSYLLQSGELPARIHMFDASSLRGLTWIKPI